MKAIFVLIILAVAVPLGVFAVDKMSVDKNDTAECASETVKAMENSLMHKDFQAAVSLFEQSKFKFVIWKDGDDYPADKNTSGPLKVIATVRETGFIVARREKYILLVDAANQIVSRRCEVDYTGP